jgi:hypothetical protein
MEIKDLIAIYAAVVSTIALVVSIILAIQKLSEEKKRIIIFVKQFSFDTRSEILITNIGHRPITITDLTFGELVGKNLVEGVPRNVYSSGADWPFPVTLTDGESFVYKIQGPISGSKTLIPTVFDSEGNKYNKYRTIRYNEKFGGFM